MTRRSRARIVCRALTTLLFALAAALPAHAQPAADYVAIAKRVTMKSLDSAVADVPFERWIADLARVNPSAITWEVNDCGEGGDGRQAPTCVEAQFKLRGDTVASASLVVADLDRKRTPPQIWWLLIGDGTRFTRVPTLSAWVAAVKAQRRD